MADGGNVIAITALRSKRDEFGDQVWKEVTRLRRYARALTRDMDHADDLVSDTLVRAMAKRHLWQPGTDLRAWLFTLMHNQYVNFVRRSVREGQRVVMSDVAATRHERMQIAANQSHSLSLRDLRRALARLPDEQRTVILLVGVEGMRYEEVADILGVPTGTIRSRISRARDALRQMLLEQRLSEEQVRGVTLDQMI